MIITKEQVERLASEEDISLKEYRETINQISKRVDIIWQFICNYQGRNLYWWSFQNDVSLGNGNGSTGGSFNILTDMEYIELTGDWASGYYNSAPPKFSGIYESGFPTQLLWDTDWENTIINTIEQEKREIAQLKREKKETTKTRKAKRSKMLLELKDKLSPDERKFVASDLTQAEKRLLLK